VSNIWQRLSATTIVGMEVWRPVLFFAILLVAMAVGKILQVALRAFANRLRSTNREITAVASDAAARAAILFFFAIGLKQAMQVLALVPKMEVWSDSVTSVIVALSIGWLAYCLVDVVDAWLAHFALRTRSKMDDMLVPMVRKCLRVTIVVLVVVQVAQLLSDKPLTSIIAGLGGGGLAVALAAQETIKNFFGSLVILADKPFELGDRVVVDGHDGPVEQVGFRSTKIRTLEGHLITVPNGELANKTIHNIGKRPYIRRLANITITYDTPPEKVQRAVEIIREILDHHEGMQPDLPPRIFFDEFNDASLNILVLYWYHPPDYWQYLGFCEKFNMELLRRFNDEGIDFAFPTQTLYVAGDPNRPLTVGLEK